MTALGPPYGLDHMPRRRGGWRPWDDPATWLPDHPVTARRIAADEPVVGLRAAAYADAPHGLNNALHLADRAPLTAVTSLGRKPAAVAPLLHLVQLTLDGRG